MSAIEIRNRLDKIKDPTKSKLYQKFFKTGPGEYGEGDVFLGISVPLQRNIAKDFSNLKLVEISKLLHSKIHEERLTALTILTEHAKSALKKNDRSNLIRMTHFYLKEKKWVNNWDLVDSSAPHITGAAFFHCPKEFPKSILDKMILSDNMWHRRIAVLTTFYFIRQGQFDLCLEFCKKLLNDKEDLMHKACGWMLREVGKKNVKVLEKFLKENTLKMPRTMLRYSIEKFPDKKRKYYLNL